MIEIKSIQLGGILAKRTGAAWKAEAIDTYGRVYDAYADTLEEAETAALSNLQADRQRLRDLERSTPTAVSV